MLASESKMLNRLKYPLTIFFGIVLLCTLSVSLIKDERLTTIPSGISKRFIITKVVGDTTKIQVYNHNIKNDADPSKLEDGEKDWATRKQGILAYIKSRTSEYPTIIGLQEVIQHQLEDILSGLGSNWAYCGVPRDTGGSDNEYNPIIYDTNQFSVTSNNTFWLSETPNVPSKSWGAKYNRIVNVVTFRHKSTGKTVNFLTTHFSHVSEEARNNSAKEIVNVSNNLGNLGPIFLSGDFNSDSTTEVYSTLTNKFTDTQRVLGKRQFKIDYSKTIDFIFSSGAAEAVEFQTMSGVYNGYYISDHTPLYGVFKI